MGSLMHVLHELDVYVLLQLQVHTGSVSCARRVYLLRAPRAAHVADKSWRREWEGLAERQGPG
jgi:hypothetical protein